MIYLLLAILLSTAIIITFRIFNYFKISIVQAITVNYLVACVFGFASEPGSFNPEVIFGASWFYLSILMGLSLILSFNLFALSAQNAGVAITAISSRMSVVIPVSLGFMFFGDTADIIKIAGIIAGLAAFYFSSKKNKKVHINQAYVYLLVLLFLTVGINDSLMKVAEYGFLTTDFTAFLATSFGFALLFGLVVFAYKSRKQATTGIFKNIIAGIWLGLLNWYSTLFVLVGLGVYQVSFFMPVYNIGVVVLSSLVGFAAFREKLTATNWAGIGLAIIAIALIATS
jgi:drug/metabolite transporter (DMT)-like permease